MIEDFEDRHHRFTGCFNFRDIGGYPTADGRTVSWGKYFRTGRQDRMTPEDIDKLKSLGIRSQIDLRKPDEISDQGRGPLADLGVDYHNIHVIPEGGTDTLSRLVGDTGIGHSTGQLHNPPIFQPETFNILNDTLVIEAHCNNFTFDYLWLKHCNSSHATAHEVHCIITNHRR